MLVALDQIQYSALLRLMAEVVAQMLKARLLGLAVLALGLRGRLRLLRAERETRHQQAHRKAITAATVVLLGLILERQVVVEQGKPALMEPQRLAETAETEAHHPFPAAVFLTQAAVAAELLQAAPLEAAALVAVETQVHQVAETERPVLLTLVAAVAVGLLMPRQLFGAPAAPAAPASSSSNTKSLLPLRSSPSSPRRSG
jgi:hypothetical protein